MTEGFLHEAGELNGRPLREAFMLAGCVLSPEAVEPIVDILDGVLEAREPAAPPVTWEGEAYLAKEPDVWERVWETQDPYVFVGDRAEATRGGSIDDALDKSLTGVRVGFLTQAKAPYALLIVKGDLDPSTFPTEKAELAKYLESLTYGVRQIARDLLRRADVSMGGTWRPLSLFYGRVEIAKEELADIRKVWERLRRDPPVDSSIEGALRKRLRGEIGFYPYSGAGEHASHIAAGASVHYQVEPLQGRFEEPGPCLATLRIQWETPEGASEITTRDPSGTLPHVPGSPGQAATPDGLLALMALHVWLGGLVEKTWELLGDIDAAHQRLVENPPRNSSALDGVEKLRRRTSTIRQDLSWALYHESRDLHALTGQPGTMAGEQAISPPRASEDRPWGDHDGRFITHAAGANLDLLEHVRELSTEASEQGKDLMIQVQSRISIHHSTVMTWLTIAILVFTFVVAAPQIPTFVGWLSELLSALG